MATRHRPTELEREIDRRSAAISLSLGRDAQRPVSASRSPSAKRRQGWGSVKRRGARSSVASVLRCRYRHGSPLASRWGGRSRSGSRRPLGEPRAPIDAGHLGDPGAHPRARPRDGSAGTFELPTRPADPARSTDVGIRDDRHRVLIQVECWNTFGDIGAAIRATNRKASEAADHAIASTLGDAEPYRVATVWVVRATAGQPTPARRRTHTSSNSAFPGSSRGWVAATHARHRTTCSSPVLCGSIPQPSGSSEHRRSEDRGRDTDSTETSALVACRPGWALTAHRRATMPP